MHNLHKHNRKNRLASPQRYRKAEYAVFLQSPDKVTQSPSNKDGELAQGSKSLGRQKEPARVSDLDIVDFLEIFGSTTRCSEFLGISQSSCSRRYRLFSSEFDLGIGRLDDGYRPSSNADILDSLRQTAQKLRLRSGRFRYAIAWPCGDLGENLMHHFPHAIAIPIAPMGIHEVLNMLDHLLIDLVICGLMELQALLPLPLLQLNSQSFAISTRVHVLPLCRWELLLMAHGHHPLANQSDVQPRHLLAYPSPSLPLGTAPHLMQHLSRRGLGTSRYRLSQHHLRHWEGAAADGHSLSYAAPHQLARLAKEFGLAPLAHHLGIHETLALVGHAEALASSSPIQQGLRQALQQHPEAHADGMVWLDRADAPILETAQASLN